MLASLVLAVRFLTIVPVPGREAEGDGALGRAAWWFPAVGLGLGLIAAGAERALAAALPPTLAVLAALVLWKALTGAIHLDGLADCLDGLAGRDAAHRLAIMRDSRVGVFGAVGLILYLLAALLSLAELPAAARGRVLLLAPVVGRLAPLLFGPRFRAATPGQGLGSAFLGGVSPWAGSVNLVGALALAAWLLGPLGAALALGALAAGLAWTAFMASRLGGINGDALGSGVELCELGVLVAAASAFHLRLV